MVKKNKNKKWFIMTWVVLICCLLLCAGITIFVDPFFHYHKPLHGVAYEMEEQRYINDGIIKQFEYDSVIIGTSMTENFMTSEFDKLWGTRSMKVPFSAGSYREINENLTRAFEVNPDIKYVLRALDNDWLLREKDFMYYQEDYYPDYLYDKNVWNDVNYLFNKNVLFKHIGSAVKNTLYGKSIPTFDEYSNWNADVVFSKNVVLEKYIRRDQMEIQPMTEEFKQQVLDSVDQNITSLAAKNPDTTFYLFFPPVSVVWWDNIIRAGMFEQYIESEKIAIEEFLKYDNIEIYSFSNNFDLITDLDRYTDLIHYNEKVNSQILHWICQGEFQLTEDSYMEYIDEIRAFYRAYNYDLLFESVNIEK